MFEIDQSHPENTPDTTASPGEPGLVIRRIRKEDGRYLLLYTMLRESGE